MVTQPHPSHIDIPQTTGQPTQNLDDVEEALSPFPGPSEGRPAPARGILKNPLRRPSQVGDGELSPATDAERAAELQHNLHWDEQNIAETDLGKEGFEKIDEPKTPFVRYDAENDLVLGDVPPFDLRDNDDIPSPRSSSRQAPPSPSVANNTAANARRPSVSTSSSRSASFSLPTKDHPVRPGGGRSPSPHHPNGSNSGGSDAESGSASGRRPSAHDQAEGVSVPQPMGATQMNTAANAGEVFSSDEEPMDEETKKRHEAFEKKRGAHYSNEAAIAMRRARELMEKEEDSMGDNEVDEGYVSGDDAAGGPNGKPNGVLR